jgi:hypothetical protein
MGLAERRRIATIKEETTIAQTQFNSIINVEIPLTFDTTTLPEDMGVLDNYDYYKDYVIPAIIRIFKDLTKDDLGKEAVKSTIKSVKIINTSKNVDDSGEKSIALHEGELLIKFGFYRYSDAIWDENELKAKIENLL